MENATKALVIAGAMLTAIAIIALGVGVFNDSAEPVGQVQDTMDTTTLATFNNQFLKYNGKQSGSKVKALAGDVMAHNANSDKKVKFNGSDVASSIITAMAGIDSMKAYNVTMATDANGYINSISATVAP